MKLDRNAAIKLAKSALTTVTYLHALRVASNFSSGSLENIVAILHDVVEDGDNPDALYNQIIVEQGIEVAELVGILSHNRGETYFDYVRQVATNSVATRVKIADIHDNLTRKDWFHKTDNGLVPPSLVTRYNKALNILGA